MPQLIYTSNGAPSSTPAGLGYINIDTTNDRVYFAVDTSSSSDWQLMPTSLSDTLINSDLDFGGNYKAINLKGLDFQTFAESTISGGAISPNQSLVSVDTEANASTDDVDTITITTNLNYIFLKLEDASRVATLKHGTGNLALPNGADVSMVYDVVYPLIYDGSNWLLLFDPAGLAVNFPIADGTNLLKGSLDASKQVRFEADTNTPSSTTIVVSTPTADLDMNNLVQNSGSGTNNAVPRFDGDGQTLQDSGILIDDSDNISNIAKISTLDHIEVSEIAAPATPASGKIALYGKSDGQVYIKDDAGLETSLTGGASSDTMSNVGTGVGVYKQKTGSNFELRTPKAGNYISLSLSGDDILISGLQASEAQIGSVELATSTETLSGVSDTLAVHPLGLKENYVQNVDNPNDQTGTAYTLQGDTSGSDKGKTIWMNNASSNVLTIDTNANESYEANFTCIVMQEGVGQTTITAASGVTLNGTSAGSVVINNQYQGVTLVRRSTDVWIASGDLT